MLHFSLTISNSYDKLSCLILKNMDNQLTDIPISQIISAYSEPPLLILSQQ